MLNLPDVHAFIFSLWFPVGVFFKLKSWRKNVAMRLFNTRCHILLNTHIMYVTVAGRLAALVLLQSLLKASLVSGFRMRGPLLDQNNHTTCNDANLCVNLFPLKIILVIIYHRHMMVYKYICQTFNLISAFLHQVDCASYPNQSVQVSRYYWIVMFAAYVSYLK